MTHMLVQCFGFFLTRAWTSSSTVLLHFLYEKHYVFLVWCMKSSFHIFLINAKNKKNVFYPYIFRKKEFLETMTLDKTPQPLL